MKGIGRRSFYFFRAIRRRPVRNHFGFVPFLAGLHPCIGFVARKHIAVGRCASVQFHQMFCAEIGISHSVATVFDRLFQKRAKRFAERGKIDPVLRTFWSCNRGLHVAEIQFEIDRIIDVAFLRHAEHFLGAKIIFERGALFIGASGRAQIRDRFLINRKKSHRRAVLGRHVANCRAVRHRQ